jgi:hypothetical protein
MKCNITRKAGRLICAAGLALFSVQLIVAQEFTVHMKDDDGNVSTHYVSRYAVRNVSSVPAQSDMIYRLDRNQIITINHKDKTYGEISVSELQGLMDKKMQQTAEQKEAMRRMGYGVPPTVTKLGPGETICGYATEKYSIKSSMTQGENWVAPGLEVPAGYYDMLGVLGGGQITGVGDISQLSKAMGSLKGFVLKSVATMSSPLMKNVHITTVAADVEKGPIPPSTFEPPAGYTKLSRR